MCLYFYDFSQQQLTITDSLCPKLNWTTLRNELYWRLNGRQSGAWERFRFSNVKNLVPLSWKSFEKEWHEVKPETCCLFVTESP